MSWGRRVLLPPPCVTNHCGHLRRDARLSSTGVLPEPFRLSLTGRFDDVNTSTVTTLVNTFPVQDGTVATGTIRGTLDTRDFATNPTGGSFHTAWLESGVSNLRKSSITSDKLGTSPIAELAADLRRYVPLRAHK